MQIVIDIPENDYDDILNGETKASALNWSTFNAIRDGISLPKETMKDCISKSEVLDIIENWDNSLGGNIMQTIRDLPTLDEILEADEAESEEI